MLYQYFLKLSEAEFAKNKERRAQIRTPEDVFKRQQYLRRAIQEVVGKFPVRTPLKPRTVGKIECDGYVIEKVIFESQPRVYVTANLYLPDRAFPVPAVVSPCGHAEEGKACETYQRLYILLARNGYAVLAYDPVGQGERLQSWDAESKRFLSRACGGEHSAIGHQCVLTGTNLALYRIWDGMRAMDYLESRPEVDKQRIGITGNSGGGTLTAYLTAIDDRIAVSIPSCYITSFKELFTHSSGPQDAEQCFTKMLSKGLDYVELLLPLAPRPLQINAAVKDFFPIAGTRDTFRELKRIYRILGAEERVNLVVDPGKHGYNRGLREQAAKWFNKWMKMEKYVPEAKNPMIHSERKLRCTGTGQMITSLPGARVIQEVNRERASRMIPPKAKISSQKTYEKYRAKMLRKVKKLLAYRKVDAPLKARVLERVEKSGRVTEKISFQSEPGITLSGLLMKRCSQPRKVALLISEKGNDHRETLAKARKLVSQDTAVLSIEDRYLAVAEKPPWYYRRFVNKLGCGYTDGFVHGGWMLGKPLLGMLVTDVLRAVDYLKARKDLKDASMALYGIGDSAVIALYAAALDRRIDEVHCEGMLISYQSLVMNKFYNWHPRIFLPGVIGEFDLDDVAALVAPRPLALMNLLDERRKKVSPRQTRAAFSTTAAAYRALRARTFKVLSCESKPGS